MPISSRMLAFLYALPVSAFSMSGDTPNGVRLLYTFAPQHAPEDPAYARVLCRSGFQDTKPGTVHVYFVLPATREARQEVLEISIDASAWNTMAASTWKTLIVRCVPCGIVEFPPII